jgi:serine protease
VDISHTYVQDLIVSIISPSGKTANLHNRIGGDKDDILQEYDITTTPGLADLLEDDVSGDWRLSLVDCARFDKGKLNRW